ncbi:hypothetical protein IMW82_13180 [Rhodanobacter sp. B2A1Ga4]|uniref:hypothetical protein n=1 Tax=Rhodanobacter sp. B2A1Ga4 TaxID=2778647 RepID=UPI001B358D38|nr:hypothetical protein [Rhodanobacter sp. B2A1Ga4]MBQ4855624.1 hypothetical protein [Rhodanobacter sp. B2A1Ga4]
MTNHASRPYLYLGTRVDSPEPTFGWVAWPVTDTLVSRLRHAFMQCVDRREDRVVYEATGSLWSPTATPAVMSPSVEVSAEGMFRLYGFAEPEFNKVSTSWHDVERFAANVASGERCFEEDPERLKDLWQLAKRRGASQ